MEVLNVNDFNELKGIMEKDSGETLVMYESMRRIFIDGIETQLMLRLNRYNGTIVIARILVCHKYIGVGTVILNWLKGYAKRNDYGTIMIESTTTAEINRFAEKHGFELIGVYFEEETGEKYGNYLLKL